MRYGTRTNLKRRWTPKGHRPKCQVKIGYEFGYLYTSINPYSGELYCLMLPRMTKTCFEVFLRHFGAHVGRRRKTLLVMDQASNHQTEGANWKRLQVAYLPPASPELNPVERFFKELRRGLANQVFKCIREVEDKIIKVLNHYWNNPKLIMNLTAYPYLRNTS